MSFEVDNNKNYERAISLMALDENFVLVTPLVYSSLQWSRKFHEPGIFSAELIGGYDSSWKYIYSPDRRELGKISQVNLQIKKGVVTTTISGKFIEDELNKMIVYIKPKAYYGESGKYSASIVQEASTPIWTVQDGTADDVALAFFDGFKRIAFTNYDINADAVSSHAYELDIEDGTVDQDHGEYKQATHSRGNQELGHKIYDILKESGASYQVNFDYETMKKTFDIVHGRDLSGADENTDVNPVVFSTLNGTISAVSLVKSDTNTKDIVLSTSDSEDENIVLVNGYTDAVGRFLHSGISTQRSDYWDSETPAAQIPAKDEQYKVAVMKDARNELYDKKDIFNADFEVIDGSYEYMKDFDLGDLVAVEVPEVGLSINTRIIACYEKVNNGVWSLSLEFGTPLAIRRRNGGI